MENSFQRVEFIIFWVWISERHRSLLCVVIFSYWHFRVLLLVRLTFFLSNWYTILKECHRTWWRVCKPNFTSCPEKNLPYISTAQWIYPILHLVRCAFGTMYLCSCLWHRADSLASGFARLTIPIVWTARTKRSVEDPQYSRSTKQSSLRPHIIPTTINNEYGSRSDDYNSVSQTQVSSGNYVCCLVRRSRVHL